MRLSDYESGQAEKERDGKAGRFPACISMLKRNYDEIGPVNTSDSESDGSWYLSDSKYYLEFITIYSNSKSLS